MPSLDCGRKTGAPKHLAAMAAAPELVPSRNAQPWETPCGADYSAQNLGNQGRPARIGSIQGRDDFALIVSNEIDTVDARATIWVLPEEGKHPPFGAQVGTRDGARLREQPGCRLGR